MFSVGNRITVNTDNYAHLKRYTKAIGTITKAGYFNCCHRYYVEFDDLKSIHLNGLHIAKLKVFFFYVMNYFYPIYLCKFRRMFYIYQNL